MAEVTKISRLSVPIPIQRVVEEEESEEEVKKTSKEEVAEDVSFVGTQLDLVCLSDEIVYGSSLPQSSEGNVTTGENNNKLGVASGEVCDHQVR